MMNVEQRIYTKNNDEEIQTSYFIKMEWQVPGNLGESE